MIIYAVCLIFGLLFTAVSALMGHSFGGHEAGHVGTGGHAESGFDQSGVPGISFFSPTVLACFITAFGGLGILFSQIKATESIWISAPLSTAGAIGIAFSALWIFNSVFSRSQSSSESRVGSLVGQAASIVTPIPEGGVGEIAYVQGSTRYTAPARSEGGSAVGSGQTVKITRVIGTQFFVESVR